MNSKTNEHETSRTKKSKYIKDRLLAFLLLCSLLAHLWTASLIAPVSPAIGYQIKPPTNWRESNPLSFRVATYNIHRGKGVDGIRDIKRTAEVLRNADIVSLNEVAGPTFFRAPDQAQQIGQMLNMGWLFAPNQRRWYRDYFGNGFLSRFQIKSWYREQLVHDKIKSHSYRNLVTAKLLLNGFAVTILSTHLDRGPIREEQLRYVLEKFKSCEFGILLGDLNTTNGDPQLVELFKDTNNLDAIKIALGDADKKGRIDWIITRGFNVVDGGFTPVGVSDHPYFWVEIEFKK